MLKKILPKNKLKFIKSNIGNSIKSKFNMNKIRDIMFPGCPSVSLSIRPSVLPSVHHTSGLPLCVQRPAKAIPLEQCQHDVDVHVLFCFDLDLHNLLLRLCLTSNFVRLSSLIGTTLHAAPSKSMPFQQIIINALHCQHDVDVHLLFF